MTHWQRYLPYAFLATAVFVVYSNIYDNVFLFDDDLLIRLNTYLRSWDSFGHLFTASTTEGAHIAGGFYRPIQNLLYFFIFQVGGEQPFGFHLLNVTLHAANACLGYRLAVRLGLDPRAALLAMLVWALHPLHTEAITYMSGTADPLSVCFGLWALNILLPAMTMRRVWASVPLLMLALLSKETAVVFPALALVCQMFVIASAYQAKAALATTEADAARPRRKKAGDLKRNWLSSVPLKALVVTWPLWVIAFAYLGWRVTSPDFDGPERYAHLFNLPEFATVKYYSENPQIRFTTFLSTLPAYAQLLLWPVDLHMERAFSVSESLTSLPVVGGLLMLLAAAAQIAWGRGQRGIALSWGLLWFGSAHAPNSGVLFSMNSLFLEHWMYLPTMGLFLGVAQSGFQVLDRRKNMTLDYSVLSLALALVCALSGRTYDQNKIWREPIAFYNNIFAYGVISPRAHNNLAIAYMNIHDLPRAIEEYQRAVKEGDTYAETHYNLALALLSSEEPAQVSRAVAELERSIEIEPRFYRTYDVLAQIYAQKGETEKAEAYRRKAQEILGK